MSESNAGYDGVRRGFQSLALAFRLPKGNLSLCLHNGQLCKVRLKADVMFDHDDEHSKECPQEECPQEDGPDNDSPEEAERRNECPQVVSEVWPSARHFEQPEVAAYLLDKCGKFGRANATIENFCVKEIEYRRNER